MHDWHRALTGLGLTVDVRPPWTDAADLSGYRLVVVPTLYLSGDATSAALAGYAFGGGQLLVTYFSGIVDEHDHVRLGGYPGAFRELLGVRGEEFHPLMPGEAVPLLGGPPDGDPPDGGPPDGAPAGSGGLRDSGPLDGADATLWTERLTATDAEVLAHYAAGPLAGTPALTRRPVGAGAAWYLATRPDTAAITRLARDAGLDTAELPAGAEVVRRRAADGRSWLFVVNHADASVRLPATGTDLVGGATVDGAVLVAPGGVVVISERGRIGMPSR